MFGKLLKSKNTAPVSDDVDHDFGPMTALRPPALQPSAVHPSASGVSSNENGLRHVVGKPVIETNGIMKTYKGRLARCGRGIRGRPRAPAE